MIADLDEVQPSADALVLFGSGTSDRAATMQTVADAAADLVASKRASKYAKVSSTLTFSTSAAPLCPGTNLHFMMV